MINVVLFQPDLDAYLSKRSLYCTVEELKQYSVSKTRELIDIIVNEKGEVLSVKVGGGSTVSDEETQKLALTAAKKAKFTPGEGTQKGKIVYIFKFN